jgi:F0F1-type ATP synthase epsilon subunit
VSYQLVIRTPHSVTVDAEIRSARVPTESGLVGLRPRTEPFVSAVEPGLVVMRQDGGRRFAATSGGLIEVARERATVYTPFAVAGDSAEEVLAALDRALQAPQGELALRRQLADLEQRILQVAQDRPRAARTRASHA